MNCKNRAADYVTVDYTFGLNAIKFIQKNPERVKRKQKKHHGEREYLTLSSCVGSGCMSGKDRKIYVKKNISFHIAHKE